MDETQDPREYRGGVHEPEEAKGGQENWADNEGVVPREMIDDTGPEPTGEQDLKDAAMGEVTDDDHTGEAIDKSAGDDADATQSDSAESTTWHEDPTLSGRTGTGEA
ncbi:MAG TPA: hypothetical protein VGO81_01415 [Solirubrobacteraceae bacterium]|jgi:hypothetical protein|nr:hypothetical protein [Solirubrobacteraceae bacterium]